MKNSDSKICSDIESKINETKVPDFISDDISQESNVICYHEGKQGESTTNDIEIKRIVRSKKRER